MLHHSATGYVSSIFCILCLLFILDTKLNAQCLSKQIIWDSTDAISANEDFSLIQKLKYFYALKNIADKCNLEADSVYSKLLLKIGVNEIEANKNYNTGFNYLKLSSRINAPGKKGSSAYIAVRSFYALGHYFSQVGLSDKALNYFDSAIAAGRAIPNAAAYVFYSITEKANIFFQIGDYQKAIEENIEGINSSLQKNPYSQVEKFAGTICGVDFFRSETEVIEESNSSFLDEKFFTFRKEELFKKLKLSFRK